jgi:hypothetical protein
LGFNRKFPRRGLGLFFLLQILLAPVLAHTETGREMNSGAIPLLISDNHADHMAWLLRRTGAVPVSMLVLDAHADTALNDNWSAIRDLAAGNNIDQADTLAHNHNWIHPLTPFPVVSLAWISILSGSPRQDKWRGFVSSTAKWQIRDIRALSLEQIRSLALGDETLFISIDLDFFYSENYTPADIPFVFDTLFHLSLDRFSQDRPVLWAVCLSRPWLPSDEYAWALLAESLRWFTAKPEFGIPEITLFNTYRFDQSSKARAFRSMGMEPPNFYLKENESPPVIKELLKKIRER